MKREISAFSQLRVILRQVAGKKYRHWFKGEKAEPAIAHDDFRRQFEAASTALYKRQEIFYLPGNKALWFDTDINVEEGDNVSLCQRQAGVCEYARVRLTNEAENIEII